MTVLHIYKRIKMDKNDFKIYICEKLKEFYKKNNRTVRKQTLTVYTNKISKLYELLEIPYLNLSFHDFEKTKKE